MDCHDCHKSPKEVVDTLTESRWNDFRVLPGKNFADIDYNRVADRSNTYYCVSYVANKWYVNWFPRGGSPMCPGKFCGSLDMTNADFLQAVFNILAQTVYSEYSLSWSAVSSWLQTQPQTVKNTFTLQDHQRIVAWVRSCPTGSCLLQKPEDLSVYTKYCRWNPNECGIQDTIQAYSWLKKWLWPATEASILLKQGVFLPREIEALNIENYVSWRLVFDVFSRLKMRMQCVDSNDQDNDGILDYEDSCYLTRNPSQRDLDKDGIGDVCDDDIDGDTIKNPIGAVDDEGNIVASAFKEWEVYDNCIFIQNRDQADDDKNGIGNVCDVDEKVWLRIRPRQLTSNSFAFFSAYSWTLKDFVWYFGDNETAFGERSTHPYKEQWIYKVRLEAKTVKNKLVVAYTTVQVAMPAISASLSPEKLVQRVWERVTYRIELQNILVRDIDYVMIYRGDGRSRELRGDTITTFVDSYLRQWQYAIRWSAYTKDGRDLSLGAFVTVLWGDFCLPINQDYWWWRCDMDKDRIPDICDDDGDGDGIKNPLGLIRYESDSCTYGADNTIWTPPSEWDDSWKDKWFDNCPFKRNPDQKACDWTDWGSDGGGDRDGDGIKDDEDACPTIPENFNGIQDDDGCPEVLPIFTFPDSTLKPGICNMCPCQFARNDSALLPGDILKAMLYDKGTNQRVTTSNQYIVQ